MRAAVVHTADSPCRCHLALRRALRALGWRVTVVPVERLHAARAVLTAADAVFEHADTYRGSHALRPYVRHLLEGWGCRLVGTPAAAAQRCDDKAAARAALAAAGVPVPRAAGAAATVVLPWIAKRSFAHGSRGLTSLRTAAAAQRFLAAARAGGPAVEAAGAWVVEEFVAGRELALAGYEARGRVRWLPPVEVHLGPGGIYSANLKWGPCAPRRSIPSLPPAIRRRLEELGTRAWRALGLRDYARFDLRLTDAGEPVFLEANARPSVEPGTELVRAGAAAGLGLPTLVRRWLASARARRREADR